MQLTSFKTQTTSGSPAKDFNTDELRCILLFKLELICTTFPERKSFALTKSSAVNRIVSFFFALAGL